MDDIVIALFAGPENRIDHAVDVAGRAGFWATRVRGPRGNDTFVQLLDVLTDDSVGVEGWADRTVATAASIMGSLGFELLSVASPRLV